MATSKKDTLLLYNGYVLPMPGFGTASYSTETGFNNPENIIYNAVKEAIKCGFRHMDTAELYLSEKETGLAVNDCIKEGIVKKEDLVVVTKLYRAHMDAESVREACLHSLEQLGFDYIDIYLIHNPMAIKKSLGNLAFLPEDSPELYANIDLAETWKAMEELVKEGLVKNIGVSNFNIKQLQRLMDLGLTKPVCNQIEVSIYLPNKELVDFCQSNGIAVVGYSPLGSPGRFWRTGIDKNILTEPFVVEIAKSKNVTPAQVAMRYLIERGVCPIPKAFTPERIRQNIKVLDFSLTAAEMEMLNKIDYRYRVCTFSGSRTHPEFPFQDDYLG